jgi:hypothetical protein
VGAGEGQLHDLLIAHLATAYRLGSGVYEDFELSRRGDEALDPRFAQVEEIPRLDQAVRAAGDVEKHRLVLADFRKAVENGAADKRLAPFDLASVEGQFEFPVGQESDEALGSPLAQVK